MDNNKDKQGMKRVSFGTKSIQKNLRVALNRTLLDNLDVREGDPVDLFFDSNEKAVVIKKSQHKNYKKAK